MLHFVSTALLLFLVMDPLGNLPLFINTLRHVPPERFGRIVLRESLIAFGVLVLFMLAGQRVLELLQVSQASLGIAGGIVLFLISLKMIFQSPEQNEQVSSGEPLIVPLAIPLIAGPSAMAMVMLIQGKNPGHLGWNLLALLGAWLGSTIILLFGRRIGALLGKKTLDAGESLMGLVLTALAVEMLVNGIRSAFHIGG